MYRRTFLKTLAGVAAPVAFAKQLFQGSTPFSDRVFLNDKLQAPGEDYTVDQAGTVHFARAVPAGSHIGIEYCRQRSNARCR